MVALLVLPDSLIPNHLREHAHIGPDGNRSVSDEIVAQLPHTHIHFSRSQYAVLDQIYISVPELLVLKYRF